MPNPPPKSPGDIRVASYNLHKCVGLDRRRDPHRVARVLAGLSADVIAVQEIDRRLPPRPTALPRAVIERVCADLGESFSEVDIDSDAALLDRFGEEIPVTFVDGRQHDFWRVDEARLRAALAR